MVHRSTAHKNGLGFASSVAKVVCVMDGRRRIEFTLWYHSSRATSENERCGICRICAKGNLCGRRTDQDGSKSPERAPREGAFFPRLGGKSNQRGDTHKNYPWTVADRGTAAEFLDYCVTILRIATSTALHTASTLVLTEPVNC